MNRFERLHHVWRFFGADSPRQILARLGLLGALIALAALGSCGRTTRSTNPESSIENGSAPSADKEGDAKRKKPPHEGHPHPRGRGPGPSPFPIDSTPSPTPPPPSPTPPPPSPTPPPPSPTPPPTGASVVLVGAGDISSTGGGDDATAKLIDQIPGTVFTAGDNAYESGSASEYSTYYNPTWGRFRARTRPAPGNHEYNTSGAGPYYSYFGSNAGPSGRGYYSYNLGDWHVISLNSNIDMSAGSAQERWLRADLAANPRRCTLAYWHHPRFSSGSHGSSTASKALWQALYDAGAEVVVVGHDHNYQRFAPQTADGQKDLQRGIREFVAGTGGKSHYSFSSPIANTEAYNTSSFGVLKLTLGPGTYSWEFIPVAGQSYHDSGSGTCH